MVSSVNHFHFSIVEKVIDAFQEFRLQLTGKMQSQLFYKKMHFPSTRHAYPLDASIHPPPAAAAAAASASLSLRRPFAPPNVRS
jgi:hypothetical protein